MKGSLVRFFYSFFTLKTFVGWIMLKLVRDHQILSRCEFKRVAQFEIENALNPASTYLLMSHKLEYEFL